MLAPTASAERRGGVLRVASVSEFERSGSAKAVHFAAVLPKVPGRVYTELRERAHDQHGHLAPDRVREMGFDPTLPRTMSGLAE